MPDTQAQPPFVVEAEVAASENVEFLKAQIAYLQNRTFVMAQMMKNKDAEITELKAVAPKQETVN